MVSHCIALRHAEVLYRGLVLSLSLGRRSVFFYFLVVAYCFVGFTHEQKVAIDPSGSLRGREGTHVLVRGAYTFVFVEARISYNGKESDGISVVRNEKKNVSIVPFRTLTTGLGSNATHRLFQFEFTLLPQYNGSTIRVVGLDGNGVKNYTQPLRLTVQCRLIKKKKRVFIPLDLFTFRSSLL